MKQSIFKLTFFLLLGTILTIGVSCGLSYRQITNSIWSNIDYGYTTEFYPDPDSPGTYAGMLLYRFSRIGVVRFQVILNESHSFTVSGPLVIPADSLIPAWLSLDNAATRMHYELRRRIIVEASGWPALAFRGRFKVDTPSFTPSYEDKPTLIPERSNALLFYDKNVIPQRPATWRLIPLMPMWPGFAINIIFYGMMLWLLTLFPFTARRMIRCKRGRCMKCGYDLRGSSQSGCPECGYGR